MFPKWLMLINQCTDYHLNGPAFGVNFRPAIHRNLNLIAEYDAKTLNVGVTYALWTEPLRIYPLLFELAQEKVIGIVEASAWGAPLKVVLRTEI